MTYHYKYDENGNRTEEKRTSPQKPGQEETIRYTYDASNRLTGVTDSDGTRSYTFDEFDNRTAKKETGKAGITYTYNSLNQLTAKEQGQNKTTFTYDKKGNLKETRENGTVVREYVTDAAGRLSQAIIKDSGAKALTVCYTYDGAGNRIGKKVLQNGRTTSDTAYVTDPESPYGNILMAKDRISGKSAVFTFGDEIISAETNGGICYYGNDDRNSVTELLDETGKIQASIEYDEYGIVKNPEAAATGGNLTLEFAAVVVLVFVACGMTLTVKVRGDYLMSKEGKELLDSANQIIYKGKTYLAKQFKKLVTWTGKAVKKESRHWTRQSPVQSAGSKNR